MTKKGLVWLVIIWCLLTLINYYYIPYFILIFTWFGLWMVLLVLSLIQLIRLLKERKSVTHLRIQKVVVCTSLFLLTFFFYSHKVIERLDWFIFYYQRLAIVEKVKQNVLKPNVSYNDVICELPYEFPVVSNGGNDISIYKSKETGTVTVTFWIFRNFFNAPSTHFIYTNDPVEIAFIQEQIANDPDNNWRINNNWFRTCSE